MEKVRGKNRIRPFDETAAVTTRVRGYEAMVDVVNCTARLPSGEIVNLSGREMQVAGLVNRFGDKPSRLTSVIAETTGEQVSGNTVSFTLVRLLKKLGRKAS